MDDRDCYQAVIATLSKGITILERTADTASPSTEKKKRRDTTFTPTKQLFQLQPRSNRATSSANSSTSTNNETRSTSTNRQHGYRKEEMAVRMAAEYCMSQFVNQLGRSPFRDNSTLSQANHWLTSMDDLGHIQQRQSDKAMAATTPTSENSETDGLGNFSSCDNVRYFLLENKMILAIVDVTGNRDDHPPPGSLPLNNSSMITSSTDTTTPERPRNIPSLVAIIRDTTGKYIWTMEACYQETRNKQQPSLPQAKQHSLSSLPSSTTSAQLDSTPSNGSTPHLTTLTISNSITASPSVIVTPDEHSDYFHNPMDQPHEGAPSATAKHDSLSIITPTAVAVNNDDIPHLDSIFEKNTDNWKQWRSVKKLAEHQQEAEQLSLKKNPDKPLQYYKCLPTASNVDLD